MYIQETYVNKDNASDIGTIYGESDYYESFTDDISKLFKSLQQEYGRCQSKMYVDSENGSKHVGWVFEKRAEYQDSRNGDTYLQETWVTLLEREKCSECGQVVYKHHCLG